MLARIFFFPNQGNEVHRTSAQAKPLSSVLNAHTSSGQIRAHLADHVRILSRTHAAHGHEECKRGREEGLSCVSWQDRKTNTLVIVTIHVRFGRARSQAYHLLIRLSVDLF